MTRKAQKQPVNLIESNTIMTSSKTHETIPAICL